MKICPYCQKDFTEKNWKWDCPSCGRMPLSKNKLFLFGQESSNREGFDIDLFSKLAAIEAKNFWYRARNELLVWSFRRNFPQAQNFFEIGCGTGFVLQGLHRAFPRLDLYGSDFYERALEFSLERVPDAKLFQMDARRIPFRDEFDVIGAFDVLEHIEEDKLVLTQIFQALKPGGGLILTVPQHPFLWSKYDVLDHHVRRYRVSDLKMKAERAGFEIRETTSFVSILMPAMFASRLSYKSSLSKKAVIEAFHKKGLLNEIPEIIMTMERGLIKAGVRFPFGGSLLLVAVKPLSANVRLQKTIS